MKIHSLQVSNFKSYYGTQTIGPFNNHFTCIIGPNGNGKSNILDAMLFVFGFKSSKLRQNSLISLIHSSAYGQADEAKVKVKFVERKEKGKEKQKYVYKNEQFIKNNKNQILSFSVSRTIRRNGYSFYQLNDKKITWTQLKQLLISKDIDLEKNLFIILQGQVQRLCQLSPEKLVEYLQYISGSDQFIQKINLFQSDYTESIIHCESIKQRNVISMNLFKNIQKETFQLLKCVMLKIKLLEFNFVIVKKSYYEENQIIIKDREELDRIKEKIKEINQTITNCQNQYENMVKVQKQAINLITVLNKKIQQSQTLTFRLQKNQLQTAYDELNYKIKDLQNKKNQYDTVLKQKQNLLKMIQNQQNIKRKYHQIQEQINKKLGGIRSVNYNMIKDGNKWQKEIGRINNVLGNEIEGKIREQQQKLQQRKQKYNKFIDNYGINCQKFTSMAEKRIKLKVKIRQLTQQQLSSQSKISKLTQTSQQLNRRILQSLHKKSSLTTHQKIIQQIKTAHRLKLILPTRNTISTLREHIIFSSSLLKQQQQQYSNLISIITPQLDFIVLDKYEQAKEIIDFLNVRKIGRMSFVLKEQVEKIINDVNMINFHNNNNKVKLPLNTQRVYDLARPLTKEYQKIWYWAVGSTLIAEKLQDAVQAAFYSQVPYRVISKKGEFIDISGAMTKLPLNNNNSSNIQDRTILEQKLKVITNSLENQVIKLNKIKEEKYQANQQLQNQSNRKINGERNQEVTIELIRQKMNNMKQQIRQKQKQVGKLNIMKENQVSNLNKIESNLSQLKSKFNKIKKTQKSLSKSSWEQLLKLVEDFENIVTQLKKIDISSTIIENHEAKLKQVKQILYKIQDQIDQQKQHIQKIKIKIKQNKGIIIKLINEKKQAQINSSDLQQKVFLKGIEIQRIKGQIQTQIKRQQQKLNKKMLLSSEKKPNKIQQNKKKKNIKKKKSLFDNILQRQDNNQNSQLPTQDYFKQETVVSSYVISLLQARGQQNKLKQQIRNRQKSLIQLKNDYKLILSCLRNIYYFLSIKGKDLIEYKMDEKIRQLEQSYKREENSKIIDETLKSMEIEEESFNQEKNKKLNIKRKSMKAEIIRKKIQQKIQVKFQDILIDFLGTLGLKNINSLLQKQKGTSQNNQKFNQKTKQNKHSLKQSKYQHFGSFFEELVYEGFFNSNKIFDIGPQQQYYFNDCLNIDEKRYITSSQKQNFQHIDSSEDKNQIFEILNLQKLKFLAAYQQQRIHQLSKTFGSMSESGKKRIDIQKSLKDFTSSSHKINQEIQQQKAHTEFQLFFDSKDCALDKFQIQALEDYVVRKSQHLIISAELQTVKYIQKDLLLQLSRLRQMRTSIYIKTFNSINYHINKIYNLLTLGNAQLNMTNSINPFEGIQFSVRPYKKTWKSVNLLSGGQKTLSSLALIFACEQIKKFPFYFMDQIDAALDYKNVTNLGKYIASKKQVQHIVISLRKNMYQQCDTLICIYKVKDITHTIRVGMKCLYGGGGRNQNLDTLKKGKRSQEIQNGKRQEEDVEI